MISGCGFRPGWDDHRGAGQEARGELLSRGTVYANLNVKRTNAVAQVRINEDVLAAVVKVAGVVASKIDAVAPSVDGLLAIKGVIEVVEPESNEEEDKAAKAAAMAAFEQALTNLVEMRRREGDDARRRFLPSAWTRSRSSRSAPRRRPARKPEAIRARLAEQVAALLEASDRFDPDRLTQEALLIATKADIREELDRIASHIAQARDMLGKGGAGRPAARFPGAGIQPRGQYLLLQIERHRAHQYRARDEERRRAVPRTGPESGVRRWRRAARVRTGCARRGLMFVLSSPSGAGKTTLSRMLIAEVPDLQMSVSATTRAKRPGEIDGSDYQFVDKAKFDAMVERGELLEWADVFGNRYGTPRAPVEAALAAGRDVLFDIDWQGTQQLREKARCRCRQRVHPAAVGCGSRKAAPHPRAGFRRRDSRTHENAPPRDEPLGGIRLHRRQPECRRRLSEVQSILRAERLKRARRVGLTEFVRNLQRQLEK